MTSSIFSAGGVSQIVAGSGVSVSPGNGKGVVTISSSGAVAGVSSFNTRSGAVFLTALDVIGAIGFTPASIVSPAFTGSPTAITPTFGTNNSQLATTAFVQNAVVASTSGVVSFNTRSGAVTLSSADVTTALGYTPPNQNGATLTGVPTAPTAAPGTNNTQLANTAFVQAAVTAGTAGVASFNTRTGAVTLNSTDVVNALQTGANAAALLIDTTPTYQDAPSFTIKRHASTATSFPLAQSATLKAHTIVAAGNTNFEWGIWSYMENSATTYAENVAMYGQADRKTTTTKTTWAGVFEVCDLTNANAAGQSGAAIAMEVDVWCNGTDLSDTVNSSTGVQTIQAGRIGIDLHAGNAQQIRNSTAGIGNGRAFAGVRVTGGAGTTEGIFNNGIAIQAAADAGIYNYSKGSFWGIRHTGIYVIGIDMSEAVHTTGVAIRMKAGDAIAFDATSNYKMKLNTSSGLLEFYNGSTRHGYIDIAAGADVNFNTSSGGGGGGVSSFNTRAGAVTLSSSDVIAALGYTPASNVGVVDTSSNQTIGGAKTFSGSTQFNSNPGLIAGTTLSWNSGGGNVVFGSGKTNAFYVRIIVDGLPYYFQAVNP